MAADPAMHQTRETSRTERMRRQGHAAAAVAIPAMAGGVYALVCAYLATVDPAGALIAILAVLLLCGAVYGGLLFVTRVAVAVLPWMLVFDSLLPPLLRTFTAAAAALLLIALVWPVTIENGVFSVGLGLFVGALLLNIGRAHTGVQFIQAAKYAIFPVMACVVMSRQARTQLASLVGPVMVSTALAMLAHLAVVTAGLGDTGTFYHAGEKLGFAFESPHELALMAVLLAAAGLLYIRKGVLRMCFLLLGALPALLTGVRSALLAIAALGVVFIFQSRRRTRELAILGGAVVVVLATGALDPVIQRFAHSQQIGEFNSFATAGSGRGKIWSTALKHYADAGPGGWLFGTGLHSIETFELEDNRTALVGHSDVIAIAVQCGLFAFIGWCLMWWAMLRSGLSWLVLVPFIAYGVVNGAIEGVANVVVGLTLAIGLVAAAKTSESNAIVGRSSNCSGRSQQRLMPAPAAVKARSKACPRSI